jgi:hypothetical protein
MYDFVIVVTALSEVTIDKSFDIDNLFLFEPKQGEVAGQQHCSEVYFDPLQVVRRS